MRFRSPRDYETIIKINQELVNDVVDLQVIIYKVNQKTTKTNSYGEAPKKTYFPGVQVPCLYTRDPKTATSDMQTVSVAQSADFSFLRRECELRGIYPEMGDIIEWDQNFYEISNADETQLFGGREEYRHSIICKAHLTRTAGLQLTRPQV